MPKRRYCRFFLGLMVVVLLLTAGGQAFARSITGRDVVAEALKYEGKPVTMSSATGVQYIYGQLGIRLPGTLGALSREGTPVAKGQALQLGDIVFLGRSSTDLIAAGIYVGNDRFIVSHRPYATVRVISLGSSEPSRYYLGARRIIPAEQQTGTAANTGTGTSTSSIRERVIREGLKYVGTPYEYNSNRVIWTWSNPH